MKIVLVLVVLIPLATAHLCLLSPEQRGAISGLDMPGSDDCKLTMKECGDRMGEPPSDVLWAGMKNNIIFQKNLDHFNMKKPGAFMVNLGQFMGAKVKWTTLDTIKDSNTTSLYIYTSSVMIPDMELPHAVIQVIYNTSNPAAPAAFYQCADIMIKKKMRN